MIVARKTSTFYGIHIMALALFDLDNTLLAGDSDYLWGVFLVEKGLVDAELYEQANARFYQQYADGELDIHEFLNFSLNPLSTIPTTTLTACHQEFMDNHVRQIMTVLGQEKVTQHQQAGDTTLVITATNSFVTAPIAAAFGIEHLIATEPEIIDGQYTGKVAGTPSFQQGKVTRLHEWMQQHNVSLENSTFYSDSHNDLPLLEIVEHPIAVDPDPQLNALATNKNWEIISFRQ